MSIYKHKQVIVHILKQGKFSMKIFDSEIEANLFRKFTPKNTKVVMWGFRTN
jgi:hypothetical protein